MEELEAGRHPQPKRLGPLARVAVVPVALFLAALALGLVFSRNAFDSYDSQIMGQVTLGLVHHTNLRITNDPFGLNTPYSSYGLGMSVLMAGPYLLSRLLGHPGPAAVASMAKTNAVVFALVAVAVYWLGRLLGATRRQAVVLAALVCAGTMLLSYTSTSFSEPGVALFVTLGLAGLRGQMLARRWAPVLVGAASGGAVLMRTDSAVLVAGPLLVGLWLIDRAPPTVAWSLGGAAPFAVVWAWYNALRFGAPWRLGYPHGTGFSYPALRGLYGLTISPGRGLLWYVPLVVVAALGVRAAWQRSAVLLGVSGALVVLRILFYCKWAYVVAGTNVPGYGAGAGWGPRFLLPAMPALAVPLFEVIVHLRTMTLVRRVVVVAIAALSVVVQVVGAAVNYLNWWYAVLGGPPTTRSYDVYYLRWASSPLVGEFRELFHRRNWASSYVNPRLDWAALVVLAVVFAGAAALVTGATNREGPTGPGGVPGTTGRLRSGWANR